MATKTRRVVITLSETILKDVDWLAPLEDMTRDELISEAVERFLKPHLEVRAQVLKAASKAGNTHGPFNTADEMIADMKGRLKKRAAPKSTNLIAALRAVQGSAKRVGLDKLTEREIDAEVTAARRNRDKKTRQLAK